MSATYRFGEFELSPAARRLSRGADTVPLGARAFDTLLALIERRDRLVPKNELLEVVWPGLVVEENNLQVQVSALRKLLGPQAIATVPGRGYRFTALLEPTGGDAAPAMPARNAESAAVHGIAAEAAKDASPIAATAQSPSLTNLPADLPRLYGRSDDLAALCALIEEQRLVTVVGAGGIGKSRLAQAAARAMVGRWRDGAWMVELAGLFEPARLPHAIAQALRMTLPGEASAEDELVAALNDRSLLLVLDNCEHLLDAVATLAQALVAGTTGLRLLLTSQEPVHLPNEQQYRILPLAVPKAAAEQGAREFGALELLEARVRAADKRFALRDDELPLAIDICHRLDGLPLAIELAAARVATLGLKAVRDKLDARFMLLSGGSRATLRRHQTLRAALEWSHNLLDENERAVFRRLGVFAGGFTIELAQAVASDAALDEWAVLDILSALVDKSLVVADPGSTPRYRLLESARAFALERLAEGETAETLRRHALALRDFMRRIDDANLDGELRTDQYAALVLPELDNLRAAYAWATGESRDPTIAVQLAAHAGSLIDYAIECADWLLPLVPHVEHGGVDAPTAARFWRAIAAGNVGGHVPRTLQLEAASRAKALYEQLGQPRRVYSSLLQFARERGNLGHLEEAQAALAEARALLQPGWPPEFRIVLLRVGGTLARRAERMDEARAMFRECVELSRSSGDWRLEVIARSNLVDMVWMTESLQEAVVLVSSLVADLRLRPAAVADTAVAFANAVGVLCEAGRLDEATAAARDGLAFMRRDRNLYLEEWVYLFFRLGQYDVAARLIGTVDAAHARSGAPSQPNEKRLLEAARAGLAERLGFEAFASLVAAGRALDADAQFASIEQALSAV